MKRLILVASLVMGAAVLMSPGAASASTKFKNNSPNTIWTLHAYASTSGFLCGWDDHCSSEGDWVVEGWYKIAPGATVIVQGQGYGNAYHDAYGEDGLGHYWVGGGGNAVGGNFCAPRTAFSWCSNVCSTNASYYQFFRARGTRCCGGSCPGDGTVNFNW
jgi:hypothetical protein